MTTSIPDGEYPFIDQTYPLSEMTMVEAPLQLENLLRRQASENGIAIMRDTPVQLRCKAEQFPDDATFLVYWPSGEERMLMLVPTTSVTGRA